ncbi:MAG: cytochrome-c peroxidase [Steroidobacteraceae bacterium]
MRLLLLLVASGALPVTVAAAESPGAVVSEPALAALGRRIFFDQSLSASGRQACATCHDPRYAYGPPPGKAIALGGPHLDQRGTRAVPSLRYLRASPTFALEHHFPDGDVGPIGGFTWDGRAASIREQAKLPLLADNEMANADPADVVRKLRKTRYAAEFRALFGRDVFDDGARAFDAALQALDAFQSIPAEFYPYSSRYNAFLRGELELTDQENRGAALFKDPNKGNCASCHLGTIRAGHAPNFTDYDFVNVGVPRNPRIPVNADPNYYDLGLCGPLRQDLADNAEVCGFFRSPSMRNTAIRDAYFHNGAFQTLREVIEFYNERDLHPEKFYPRNADGTVHLFDDLPPGSAAKIDHDPPLDRKPGAEPALSEADSDDLIAFLKTLTDADVAER